jgi:hypothetical protein
LESSSFFLLAVSPKSGICVEGKEGSMNGVNKILKKGHCSKLRAATHLTNATGVFKNFKLIFLDCFDVLILKTKKCLVKHFNRGFYKF